MLASLNRRQKTGLLVGPLLFISLLLMPVPEGMSPEALRVAAVALLMATFWMAETLAIPVTALLPIILFPLLGVLPTARVTLAYGDQILFLFMGGFIIAIAMQKWNLHRRIALTVIRKVGSSPERLVLGMMLATALLSMWVSNTATAMMMTPVGIAVIESTRKAGGGAAPVAGANGELPRQDTFAIALMLSIAYAASIGGFTTLVGTPPNAIFIGQLDRLYGLQIGFLDWMLMAAPISACVLALCWFLITRVFFRMPNAHVDNAAARDYIAAELDAMGPITRQEARVAIIFALVALAWVGRGFLDQISPDSALWSVFGGLVGAPAWDMVSDSAIAMAGAFLLFVVPAGGSQASGADGFLMDWESAVKLPWDVILLMGGGFALAEAFTATGLTEWLAGQFGILQGMPVFVLTLVIVVFVVFIGEMTSNAATATMFIPVMGALAVSMGMAPLTLMVPTVIATSLGFMLPVATPPNAIVFGSRYLRIEDMVKAGFWLNIGGAMIVTILAYALLDLVR